MTLLRILRWPLAIVLCAVCIFTSILASLQELRKFHPATIAIWPSSISYDAEAQRYLANIVIKDAATSADFRLLQRAIMLEPLSQVSAVILLQQKRAEAANKTTITQLEDLVLQLGWQSSVGQITAILIAQKREDYAEMVRRTDALLRRSPNDQEAAALMVELEAEPKAHPAIVTALAANPAWRKHVLRATGTLTPDERLMRSIITEKFLRAGYELSPSELADILNPLVNDGETDKAYKIWKLFYGDTKEYTAITDADYARLSKQINSVRPNFVPFEWKSQRSKDFLISTNNPGTAKSTINIDWNGHGNPLFLSQRILLNKSFYRISLIHYNKKDFLKDGTVRLMLICKAKTRPYVINFTEENQTSDGEIQISALLMAKDIPCQYPEILMKGFGNGTTRNLLIVVGKISLAPAKLLTTELEKPLVIDDLR